jgi:hypothetical protein
MPLTWQLNCVLNRGGVYAQSSTALILSWKREEIANGCVPRKLFSNNKMQSKDAQIRALTDQLNILTAPVNDFPNQLARQQKQQQKELKQEHEKGLLQLQMKQKEQQLEQLEQQLQHQREQEERHQQQQ